MIRLFLSAVVALAALTPTVFAQSKDQDERVRKSVVAVVNAGSDVYNAGDQIGCSRMYQGALLALIPQLDHRLDLQRASQQASEMANRVPNVSHRAFAQRAVLDKILAGLSSPLWERLGGEPAVRAVVHDFVGLLAQNPKVNVTRGGKIQLDAKGVAKLEQLLVEQISSASGGPLKYTGRDMRTAHAGMMITDAEFDASAVDLITTLKKYSVPQKEADELVAIIASTKRDVVMAPALKPLYERLGGEPAIKAVVDDFVARTAGNPKVNFTRKGTAVEWAATPDNVARLKTGLVALIGQVTGGPQKYAGKDMKKAHVGMMITDAEFDALAGDLKATLDHFKVPMNEQNELLKIIGTTRGDIVEKK